MAPASMMSQPSDRQHSRRRGVPRSGLLTWLQALLFNEIVNLRPNIVRRVPVPLGAPASNRTGWIGCAVLSLLGVLNDNKCRSQQASSHLPLPFSFHPSRWATTVGPPCELNAFSRSLLCQTLIHERQHVCELGCLGPEGSHHCQAHLFISRRSLRAGRTWSAPKHRSNSAASTVKSSTISASKQACDNPVAAERHRS